MTCWAGFLSPAPTGSAATGILSNGHFLGSSGAGIGRQMLTPQHLECDHPSDVRGRLHGESFVHTPKLALACTATPSTSAQGLHFRSPCSSPHITNRRPLRKAAQWHASPLHGHPPLTVAHPAFWSGASPWSVQPRAPMDVPNPPCCAVAPPCMQKNETNTPL